MQAIIMAAGKGSRLGTISKDEPKSFVILNGERLIDRNISMLHKYGIWDITIVTGFRAERFEEIQENNPGITLVYNPFYEMTNVIGSYYMGMDHLHDDCIYLHADTVCEDGIFEELLTAKGDMVLPVDTAPCDEEAMKVKVKDDCIVNITKDMPLEEAVGEFIGIMKMTKRVLPAVNSATKELMRRKDFSSYFEGAIQLVIDDGTYEAKMLDVRGRFWSEIDFPEDLGRAEARLQGK